VPFKRMLYVPLNRTLINGVFYSILLIMVHREMRMLIDLSCVVLFGLHRKRVEIVA